MNSLSQRAWQFSGRWIGETQGIDRPAHIWEITQEGSRLVIENLWEGQTEFRKMGSYLVEDEAAFDLSGTGFKALMLDPQHFIIPGWDTLYEGDRLIGAYDVVFSRPGIAELTANQVWHEWKKNLDDK